MRQSLLLWAASLAQWAACSVCAIATSAASTTLYVNCNTGSDVNGDGSASNPWLTPNKARDTIRAMQPLSAPVDVLFQTSDCYPRNAVDGSLNFSTPVLGLEPRDSGLPGAAITYAAAPGATVRFLAGLQIPASLWTPYQGDAFQANLADPSLPFDVASFGIGHITAGGLGTCADDQLELFFNNQAMLLARFPNLLPNGSWSFLNIARVIDNGTAYVVNGTRIQSWEYETDPWMHGYWSFDWADSYVHASKVLPGPGDNETTIYVDAATPPLYGFLPEARFYGVNLLSELDTPTEYYIDKLTNILYFMPPSDITAGEVFVSMGAYAIQGYTSDSDGDDAGAKPAATMQTALQLLDERVSHLPRAGDGSTVSYVNIQGISVQFARTAGISIPSASYVTVSNVTCTNHGHNGISIAGTNVIVDNVEVAYTGCAATSLYGGDENHLVAANNSMTNSELHHYARFTRTYNPGIGWGGVGNVFQNNNIHDAPHNGMLGGGNNNMFVNNNFTDLCYEATDSGAWYAGRSWVRRGNTLIGNRFERIQNTEQMTLGWPSVQAVYLDDELSGTSIINNTFIDVMTGTVIGGGRDTIVTGNTYINVVTAVALDNRGMNWQADMCAYNSTYTGQLVADLFAVNYTQPPYATNYPPIVNSLSYHPCVPVNVTIQNNAYCNATKGFISATANQTASWFDYVSNNVEFNCSS